MLKNLVKIWHEKLFYLNRKDFVEIKSDLNIVYKPITKENLKFVEKLRGKEFVKQFQNQLDYGDYGYFACIDNVPVGYGWCKHVESQDYFFKIGDDTCYLCRFFTLENVRGHNIYPALISRLILKYNHINDFYIDVENGNISSERG